MTDHGLSSVLQAARPRVVGALTRYFGDLDLAEDLYQEAGLKALDRWPEQGLPNDPAAWLITTGRNLGIDVKRRERRMEPLSADYNDARFQNPDLYFDQQIYRDDVLRLFFTCCHPVLRPEHQVALALKVIAGSTVEEIARAFLVSPKTMEQRITRAKKRLAESDAVFETPDASQRADRLRAVSTVIYLIFNEGYSGSGVFHIRAPLCDKAIRLARLMLRLFQSEAELMGLLALCLLQHARTPARLDDHGQIILLEDQNRKLWRSEMILEGSLLVEKALRHRTPGPFQIQAAIAAVHANAARAMDTDWQEISQLYVVLEKLQPTAVVRLNRVVAVHKMEGPHAALKLLEPLQEPLAGYFHFHGVRGHLLAESGQREEALTSLKTALSLARTQPEKTHLENRIKEIEKNSH